MAGIQTSITLKDGVSPVLRKITKALSHLEAVQKSVSSHSKGVVNAKELGRAKSEITKVAQLIGKCAQTEVRVTNEVGRTNTKLSVGQRLRQSILNTTRRLKPAIDQNANAQLRHNTYLRGGLRESDRFLQSVRNIVGVYAGYRGAGGLLTMADTMTTTKARLDLVNDGLQTTDELQRKIYESAMNSRSGYAETADVVAKLATRAGNVFASNDDTIAFANTLQKMFHIAGASTQEMYSASLQLTQALGSGVLRGEELNAVFEAAPNVIQAIADYMNVPIGQIRKLAKDGEITADTIKNALFSAAEDVDKKFAQMPVTWAQTWTMFKNYAQWVFKPVLEAISKITSSDKFIALVDKFARGMRIVAELTTKVFDKLALLADYIYDNWVPVGVAITGVVGAIVSFYTAMIITKTVAAAYNGVMGVMAARKKLLAGLTFAETVNQTSLNAALMACPWVWVVGGLMILAGVIAACTLATYDWKNSNIDVVATIKNIYSKLGKFLKDTILAAWEKIKEIGVKVRDILASIGNTIVENWSWIGPIVYGVVAAFVAYKLAVIAASVWTAIVTGVMIAFKAVMAIATFVMGLFTGATWAAMSPLLIFAVIVGLIIALVYGVVAMINEWCDTSISATGIICGAVLWLWELICNVAKGIVNVVWGCVQWVIEAWKWCENNFGTICDNMGIWWDNLWIDALIGVNNFVTKVIRKLAQLAQKIQPLADLFEIDLSGLSKAADGGEIVSAALAKSKKSYKALKPMGEVNWEEFEYGSLDDAWNKGYKFGEDLEKSVKEFKIEDATDKLGELGKSLKGKMGGFIDELLVKKDPTNEVSDPAKALTGGYDNPAAKDYAKDIAGDTGDIAKNTGKTAKNTEGSEDDFKYLRQLAERDSMNRSQLIDFKVDMSNVNHIKNGLDVDEVMRRLAKDLYNEFVSKMQGVY